LEVQGRNAPPELLHRFDRLQSVIPRRLSTSGALFYIINRFDLHPNRLQLKTSPSEKGATLRRDANSSTGLNTTEVSQQFEVAIDRPLTHDELVFSSSSVWRHMQVCNGYSILITTAGSRTMSGRRDYELSKQGPDHRY
jgi:hypothetical protein